MIEDKDRYFIDLIRKANDVLKALADSREPMSIAQIMEKMPEFTKNGAFRLCVTLETIGWITQVGERYELGTGLSLLWAKKKAMLEEQRKHIDEALALLGTD
jgi:DNA-binding IclR family transcriptional regulator